MNLPTLLITALIAVILILIIVHEIRSRKKGNCSCGSSCAECRLCHKQTK